MDKDSLKKIISHSKEYGFIFPSSEIYDGLSAVYDYGQNGVALKNNIRNYWWKSMTQLHENIVGIDAAIFMHPTTWKASGHVDAFNDPLIDNKVSKKRYRADILVEEYVAKIEQSPIGYQIVNGTKKNISCKFILKGDILSFKIDDKYDKSIDLIIDPDLSNLTSLGKKPLFFH